MTAPDAQPPAAWWNPSTANTSTTPTIVRWFDAAGREIPAPKDGYTDDQFRRASAAVARCFAVDAEVAPTRSREFYNEIAHEVLVAVGAVSVASAALTGTTTPADEPLRYAAAVLLEQALRKVLDDNADDDAMALAEKLTHAVLNAEWRPVRALLASTPTEETDHGH